MRAQADVVWKVHISAVTALGRGRVTSPRLDRLTRKSSDTLFTGGWEDPRTSLETKEWRKLSNPLPPGLSRIIDLRINLFRVDRRFIINYSEYSVVFVAFRHADYYPRGKGLNSQLYDLEIVLGYKVWNGVHPASYGQLVAVWCDK